MNDKNLKVLTNIVGAVEAGGQEYGKRNYAGYAAPYANTPDEHTITLGWAQEYGANARELIRRIFEADKRLPTGSRASDIDYVRWAINIADDDRYYYAHSSDPFSFSCSTLVGKALYVCGYVKKDPTPADGHAIGGKVIDEALEEAGFTRYTWAKAGGLKPGDILIVQPYHIAIHIKNGWMVAANGNGDTVDKSKNAITTYKYTDYGTPQYVWRPKKVNKINVSSVEAMLNKDWVAIRWNPNAEQKKILINLITSAAGKKAQDEMFMEQAKIYISDCVKDYKADIKAQMMYCEIRHLGNKEPTDRIFKRCGGNYSLNNILASLKKDQDDTSNNNQVGDKIYWSRHEKCVEFINKYAVDEGGSKQEEKKEEVVTMTKTESAVSYAEAIARDDSHGYSQYNREGNPDFDCSSLVLLSFEHAGVPVWSKGARSTHNMVPIMLANGFEEVTGKVNLSTQAGLRRGDVLYVHNDQRQHTALYSGEGLEVEAQIAETGDIYGQPGDQTGWEILIQPYRNIWSRVFRYKDSEEGGSNFMFEVSQIKMGATGKDVKLMQTILKGKGYKDADKKVLAIDGTFGAKSDYALRNFQTKAGLVVDGICGPATWKKLLIR